MELVSSAEMRTLEAAAVAAGATWAGLMEEAGWGVTQAILRRMGTMSGRKVLVLVGPGNNGGDALVVARHLHDAHAHVTLYIWKRHDDAADANWRRCRERAVGEAFAAADPAGAVLTTLLEAADLVVDGLLGAGANRPVAADLAQVIMQVNARRNGANPPFVVAIDLPSGIHADHGTQLGAALHADVTVATGLPKQGLYLAAGCAAAGQIALASFALPSINLEMIMTHLLDAATVRALLPARPDDAHKGTFGKLLVLAGSLHYPGAAALACAGGARVGAGLVTLATGRTVLGSVSRYPEVTLLPLPEADWGALGPNALDDLAKHGTGYDAMVIGPGLGQAEPTKELVRRIFGLEQPKPRSRVGFAATSEPPSAPAPSAFALPPCVLDADGLNLLAAIEGWPEHLVRGQFVFTPHPGEMRRLLGVESLPADLVATVRDAAQQWGQVVVLKGATTLVGSPDGQVLVHAGANTALATAGTGDVLAGVIGGLLAQGVAPFDAAALGVYLHASAGALVRAEFGAAGALASDLLPYLPKAIKALSATG
jgi:NAD(P)H-hydrate epimerase